MSSHQWNDDTFLDVLRDRGDEAADGAVRALEASHGIDAVNRMFPLMRANDEPLPDNAPAPLRRFVTSTQALPADIDAARIDRGEQAFSRYLLELGILMLVRALPAGYAAPRLSQVLCISNDLGNATFNRVLSVAQLLVNVGTQHGFEPGGHALVTAQKMRLLHAGARHVARRWLPDFAEVHGGVPISIEDMLGTLMGFSYLVIDGLDRLDVGLSAQEAEDIYYLWQVYGVMMGIHPPTAPDEAPSFEWIPPDMDAARNFYRAYARRHYTDAADNPEGCYLSAADVHLLTQLIPRPLRWLGFGLVPRLLMEQSLGRTAMARVGLDPAPAAPLLRRLYLDLPLGLDRRWHTANSAHGRLFAVLLQDFIVWERGAPIGFALPDSRADLERLAYKPSRPCLQRERGRPGRQAPAVAAASSARRPASR